MNAIRTWLDHRNIEPISFEAVLRPTAELGLKSPAIRRMRLTCSSENLHK